ncbi:LysR family transcriptional regulator [Kribbella italica]|uniref:DNA-binding transcriptional LysR family regulator n=1 Tax=Kribbella italica TaxID=1540520 RepID=A0A7W9MZM6_9ACTN|nr:DNA-binding transcriptional LysR family regulator [Kribbella italica]
MDLEVVRTFVTATDAGQFQAAADELRITQQAVSKRIAALERDLGVLLFTRSPRGAQLSVDGHAFLPHARELLRVAQQAEASVRTVRRALRIDVLNRRTAPAAALHAFHQLHPGIELDVVELPDASIDEAVQAVADGTIDATFRCPRHELTGPVRAERVVDDRHQLLVGPRHPLASAAQLTLADLAPYPIWMPGLPADTEWGSYYAALADAFALTIDTTGPSFGIEVQLDELAASADRATLVGEGTRYLWPAAYDLRRIPIVAPTPVYPHSIIWRAGNRHPGLAVFLGHLRAARATTAGQQSWVPP